MHACAKLYVAWSVYTYVCMCTYVRYLHVCIWVRIIIICMSTCVCCVHTWEFLTICSYSVLVFECACVHMHVCLCVRTVHACICDCIRTHNYTHPVKMYTKISYVRTYIGWSAAASFHYYNCMQLALYNIHRQQILSLQCVLYLSTVLCLSIITVCLDPVAS